MRCGKVCEQRDLVLLNEKIPDIEIASLPSISDSEMVCDRMSLSRAAAVILNDEKEFFGTNVYRRVRWLVDTHNDALGALR